MSRIPLKCPHCGAIDWSRTPRLKQTLDVIGRAEGATAREIADTLGHNLNTVTNRLAKLKDWGLVQSKELGDYAQSGGGYYKRWFLQHGGA